jgi:opacity protein-like surface antigen
MENETDVNTLLVSSDFTVTEKLKFNGGIIFNWGKSKMDNLSAGYYQGTDPAKFGYDHAIAFSVWEDNSELKIEEFEYFVGCSYDVNEHLSLNLNVSYTDYNDKEPYLYDTDGDFLLVNTGLTYRF